MSYKILVVDNAGSATATETTKTANEIAATAGAAVGTVKPSIANVATTNTYATDGAALVLAINSLIAVLLAYGMILPAA